MTDSLLSKIDRTKITPMMLQYIEQKNKWQDCILFYRLGDFYEMFFDDAVMVSRELELALTGRDCGLDERAPMCGVPYHAAESYLSKLVARGYKVAICEQVEDPALAKGLVRREVIRVVTPGTVTDTSNLDEKSNNYLCGIFKMSSMYGIVFADITTGTLDATMLVYGNTAGKLIDELSKRRPAEIICNQLFFDSEEAGTVRQKLNPLLSVRPDDTFSREHFIGYFPDYSREGNIWIYAAAGLINYICRAGSELPGHMNNIRVYSIEEYMMLDAVARRNLELCETMRDRFRRGSLLWAIDRTATAMGGRMLRRWVEQPLISVEDINFRLDAVSEAKDKFILRQEIMESLTGVNDIERLTAKISLRTVNARDLISLRNALQKLPSLKSSVSGLTSELFKDLHDRFDLLDDITELISSSISDDAPLALKEGTIIRSGYDLHIDQLRDAAVNGKKWILDYESALRERSGIKNLKIKYTNNFGFMIEISNSNKVNIPDDFVRRQTLVNAERFITEELNKMEETILGAEQKLIQADYDAFCGIREQINLSTARLLQVASVVSTLDSIVSLAEVADRQNYCMPTVDSSDILDINEGRHPVVERMIRSGDFVPNSVHMDSDADRLLLITGPNMGGKSTYMRQIAQIVLLAQIGSFVPAKSARIGIVDKIFTRVGASDDLSSGQSTFMVEMSEVATILKNATPRSLLILDEVGRGTSTYDGLSIAWAVTEYISNKENIGCRTLFATHYHELIGLESTLEGVKNYHVEVEETDRDVIFLHKVREGGCNDSYGIDVARLAGVPEPVIRRSREILAVLEKDRIKDQLRIRKNLKIMDGQVDIFTSSLALRNTGNIIEELKLLDVQKMTPLEALNILYDLADKARKLKSN
ncbi:MAG: DNA mismatch repair protein MutS [Saccharofermentanales bacterium]